MNTIILQIIKDKKVSLLTYCIIVAGLIMLFASFMPFIADQSEQYEDLLAAFPPAFTEAFGIESFSFSTLEAFLSVEFYSIMWPIIMILLATGLAGFLIAGEIENGTIEYILARPLSRWKIFIGKYLGGVVMLTIFNFVTAFFSIPAAIIMDIGYSAEASVYIFILNSLFSLAVFSIGMMFSAMFSEKGKASLAAGGVLLVMYVANIAATIIDKAEWAQYISFFHYFDYEAALVDYTISWESWAVFLGTIIVATVAGGTIFKKRDITT